MPVLYTLLGLSVAGYLVFSFVQMLILVINVLYLGGDTFFTTDNIFSWVIAVIIMFLLVCSQILVHIVYLVVAFISGAISALVTWLVWRDCAPEIGVTISYVLFWIMSVGAGIFAAITLANFTSAYPELSGYFGPGNWFGYIAVFLFVVAYLVPKFPPDYVFGS